MTDALIRLSRLTRTFCVLIGLCFGTWAAADQSVGTPQASAHPPSAFQRQLDRYGIPFRVPPEGKAILVNIPAFELITFEDGMPVFRSRVIVGAPWHRTPRIQTYTSAVRFRPTWRPTPSMVASGEYRDRVVPAGPNNNTRCAVAAA